MLFTKQLAKEFHDALRSATNRWAADENNPYADRIYLSKGRPNGIHYGAQRALGLAADCSDSVIHDMFRVSPYFPEQCKRFAFSKEVLAKVLKVFGYAEGTDIEAFIRKEAELSAKIEGKSSPGIAR